MGTPSGGSRVLLGVMRGPYQLRVSYRGNVCREENLLARKFVPRILVFLLLLKSADCLGRKIRPHVDI